MTVLAVRRWPTNGHLIADVARLGYITTEDRILDPTYGKGVWWRRWQPDVLVGQDLAASKGAPDGLADFTDLPYDDRSFDVVAFDPPYKLNGRPDPLVDERYGVDGRVPWQVRLALCLEGLVEACRVADRIVLAKCQDQVCSGAIRWQTDAFMEVAAKQGFAKLDRFDFLAPRAQPETRPCRRCGGLGVLGDLGRCGHCEGQGERKVVQRHAYGRGSTLLVFQRAN